MNVCVRLFAAARQAAGCDRVEVELPSGATISQLRRRLAGELPGLAGLVGQAMFAIDAEYARDGDEIRPGVEVACIPPISGG